MIEVSDFSQKSGLLLLEQIEKFKIPEKSEKEKLWFLSGDMTAYGHKDIKMSDKGYQIVKSKVVNSFCLGGQGGGDYEVRGAVAEIFSKELWDLSREQSVYKENLILRWDDVILTHGANMGLLNLIFAFCNEGDNILVPEPSYPFYQKLGKGLGVGVRAYDLVPARNWEVDLEKMESLLDERTRFIWIVNPSNPCGSIFSLEHIKDILRLAQKHRKIVVSDEVYFNENFSKEEFHSFGEVAFFNEINTPVILVGGMEKTFLVPGWQTSWIIFIDKQKVIQEAKKAVENIATLWNPPSYLLQNSLPEILEKLTLKFTLQMMPTFESNHDFLFQNFSQIKGLKPVKAQGTFYLSVLIQLEYFPQFANDVQFLQKLLDQQNVWILALSCFGGGVNGFRIMTAAPREYYSDIFERIQQFVNNNSCQK